MPKEDVLRDQIINTGKKLYELRLVVGRAGNLSARIDAENILITATGTCLGSLKKDDVIKVNIVNFKEDKRLSSEFPLHKLIHENFKEKVVIHCHPSLINGYFSVSDSLKTLTFETKLYLGDVPVVPQETPAITKPQLVIDALKLNNLVVIKNHGVVAIAENFDGALYLIETLEEAIKVASVARIYKKDILDDLDRELVKELSADAYEMFSKAHIQAIVDLVNKDNFIKQKGQELDLTLKLAIKLDETGAVYKFNFEKGSIVKLEFDEDAPFIISAPADIWELVFLGRLDSFVAVTQGKMKLKGEMGKLSKWYVPFSRLFELFKQVKIK